MPSAMPGGDREHVLDRAADLDADRIVGGVDAQRRRRAAPRPPAAPAPSRCSPRPAPSAGRARPRSQSSVPTARRPRAPRQAAAAISWPSQPVPSSKPLHSHSTPGRVGRQGAQHRGERRPSGWRRHQPAACMRDRGIEVGRDLQARRQRDLGQVAGVAPQRAHVRRLRASRAHSRVTCRVQALTASAVPQAPPPSTVRFMARATAAESQFGRMMPEPFCAGLGPAGPAGPRTSPGSSLRRASPAGSRRACRRRRRSRAGTDRRCRGRRCRGSAAAARAGCCGSRRCRPAWPRPGTSVLSLTLVVTVAVTVTS